MRIALPLVFLALPAIADPARIVEVSATQSGADWRISVTLEHGDTGWEDYADGWRVEAADGTVLGTRELLHPHVNEQPFTRSHTISIPTDTRRVHIRASTLPEGWATDTQAFDLP
ncbi:hypothetical protein PARPLA_00963 [Rhodobacteraceae bacterium THAF1]|uniref:hypothetical protein n=1 Tax=Palleronia sp. THAF1 TaxID=2587842 RepID=UPI000F3F2BE1|nr:hypothetical protein [Palleronia sp. THAF1]QFU07499.1 hypothetical protein FIU81_02290 [Palleronia sp. THAF1]VDC20456.1 hypothetical protein PARPLA_00963 [Rhodobacteraceae bacterium THAF1]